MRDYVITCCSTVDLNREALDKINVPFLCFTFTANGETYKDDYGLSYPIDKFYKDIAEGMQPTTSQINAETYKEFFEYFLKEGKDVLHLTLSSGISGSFNSANIAANMLNEEYESQVHVLDSLSASAGFGLLIKMVKDNQDNGMSLEENKQWIIENRTKVAHLFFSSDLSSFIRGGRISKTAGLVGQALQICPVMCVTEEGKLEVIEKVRTKKKAMKTVVDRMLAEVGPDYDGYVISGNSACLEDSQKLVEMVKENFPKIKEVEMYDIGTVIGSHTGPGTVTLVYFGKKRPA
ncbi:MAG: DegV family protein [Erysipelotrichaceae bacterium]|nr:DegV family protein [Erysipelotrichaceae bacterium]